jgi:hypothetical protein
VARSSPGAGSAETWECVSRGQRRQSPPGAAVGWAVDGVVTLYRSGLRAFRVADGGLFFGGAGGRVGGVSGVRKDGGLKKEAAFKDKSRIHTTAAI